MVNGHEYRIQCGFKRRITESPDFTGYEELYGRVTRLAALRVNQLRCAEAPASFHSWIVSQVWMCSEPPYNFAAAFLTTAVISTDSVEELPAGEERPTSLDLSLPRATLLCEKPPADEIYNEFDFSDRYTPTGDPIIVSYGERVERCAGIDFEPFLRSAEALAGTYSGFLSNEISAPRNAFEVIGHEWYSVTSPDLAVVHVYMRETPI
jgi:hypothetical protein